MGKVGCDISEKWVSGWRKKEEQILRYGEKGCATYGRNGCLGGGIKYLTDSAPKKELSSEIWGKGVCDIWEKSVSGWRNKIPAPRKVKWIHDAIHTA